MAWQPTNNLLATCGADGMLRLWDAQAALLSSSRLSEKPQCCIAWSPDGSSLVVGGDDGQLRHVTLAETMDSRVIADIGSAITSIVWHPFDDLVAIGTENAGVQTRAADGELIQSFTALGSNVRYVKWSPDGKTLAVGAASLSTADFSQRTLAERQRQIDKAHEVAWNPVDGSLIWCTRSGFRRLSNASAGEPSDFASRVDRTVLTVDWHPSGDSLATAATDSVVRVWGRDGGLRAAVRSHESEGSSVAWSPNGLFLATCGGWGGADWTVRLWRMDGLHDLSMAYGFPRLHQAAVLDVAWSHDSVFVASASDDRTVRLWDATARKPGPILSGHQQRVLAVDWNSRERILASAGDDHTIRVWDVRNPSEIDRLSSPRVFPTEASWIRSIEWSPDNSQIAYAGLSSVTLMNASTGEPLWSQRAANQPGSLSWHPDGHRIACGAWGHLDPRTGSLRGETIPHQVALDPTGQLLAGGANSTVQVWDIDQGCLVWLALLLTDRDAALFTGAGELRNPDPRFDEQLVYIVQDDEGYYQLAAPTDFRGRYDSLVHRRPRKEASGH